MRKTTHISLLFFLSFFFTFSSKAQIRSFFSTDNGLSNSLINQIYQDKKGYIWIATEYGLNKFDGLKFTTYYHIKGDSTSIKHNYIKRVFESSTGDFYIGTLTGLMKFNKETDSFLNIELSRENKIVHPHISSIIESKNGDIWLTTSGQGVFRLKHGENKFKSEADLTLALNSIYLNSIYEDSQGLIWFGSENNGLNYYNPQTEELKSFKAPNEINSNNISVINEDSEGTLFVGTLTKGLNKYNREAKKFEPITSNYNSSLFIKTLELDSNNRLFIGTDGQGLYTYNHKENKIENYQLSSAPFNISKEKIHSILFDNQNNLWLGFFQKGLLFIPISGYKFDYYGYKSTENNIIGSNSVTSIYKDSDGILWVGTDNDGLYGINKNKRNNFHYKKTSDPNSVPNLIHCIFEDSSNNLWLGSYTDGLAKFNKQNGKCEYIKDFTDKKVYNITEDKSGNLLVGTFASGFYLINKEGVIIEHFESSKREMDLFSVDELSNDWINTIMIDRDGLVWIGHYKGLSCYNPENKSFLTFFKANNILPGTEVNTLLEDKYGKIWIGTSSGLYSFNKKTEDFEHYTITNGLSNDVICGIREDNQDNLWISTYRGISKLKRKDNTFHNYFASDGLQGNEFSKGAVYQDKNGKIYFGGINGVTSFFPYEIVEEKKELNISLTNFFIYNKAIKKGEKSNGNEIITNTTDGDISFKLNHNENTFSFEFSTFEFSNPEKISYLYKIEQLDSEWINTSSGVNKITYNNLLPGKYTFKVKAYDNNNFSPVKSFNITILPPWYKSIWAYGLYVLLFLLLIFSIVEYILSRIRYKQELQEKEQAEKVSEAKLQFFINISHEIRTPMTLIINPLEKLIKENKNQDTQKTYLMIYRNAQRILRLINQLMDIRKLDKGQMTLKCRETNLVGFIEDLVLTFEYMATKKNIKFTFEHEMSELMVWIDLNNFDKVLLNILSNAFKYTPENGEIKIILTVGKWSEVQNYFEIKIIDNGIGIDKDKIEAIFERFYQIDNDKTNSNFGTGIGLHLAKLLVEMHQGIIFAENRTDTQGSQFTIQIPLGNKHFKPEGIDSQLKKSPTIISPDTRAKAHSVALEQYDTTHLENKKSKTNYSILVVEDEDEIREYIKNELLSDYKISEAKNGKEALDFILKEKPDLIVSDVMMPEMDGILLSKKVKENININHIPIILLTAKVQPEDKIEGLEIGADAYLTKPFNTDILKQTINNLISNRERLKNKYSGQQNQEDKIETIKIKSSDEIFLERVMKTINDNLSNPELNVEMLAQEVGISRVHMHRKLKELTNQSASSFIRAIRLKQAATLLTSKKLYISEVAYATGFSNISHFSNSFKEFYGMSPTEYVKEKGIEEDKRKH